MGAELIPSHPLTEAAREYRKERANFLLQEYTIALVAAQASHEAMAWIKAGSIFKRYAEAAVAAEQGSAIP